MQILKPTAAQIRAYRDQHGCSLQEAKAVLLKQWRLEVLEVLRVQCVIGEHAIALHGVIGYLKDLES